MIKGERVNLRPMESRDADFVHNWLTNQEYVGEFNTAELCYKEEFIEGIKKNLSGDRNFFLIIEDKEGTPLGFMNFFKSIASKVSIDFGLLVAERNNRSKGIGKEALKLFCDHIFNTRNLMRIQYMTRVDNEAMKGLGQKLGFKLEGVLRGYTYEFGEYRDMCVFGMTREDWLEKRK